MPTARHRWTVVAGIIVAAAAIALLVMTPLFIGVGAAALVAGLVVHLLGRRAAARRAGPAGTGHDGHDGHGHDDREGS